MKRNYHKPKILIPDKKDISPATKEEVKKEDVELQDFTEAREELKNYYGILKDYIISI